MIYPFNSKEIPSLAQVGGKAKALIETTQAGFNVPEGFVCSIDFFKAWTDEMKSTSLWGEFLKAATRETCVALQERARQLRFTPEQRAAIEQQLAKMPKNTLFAVRSSSSEEDLTQASFAGQYKTVLGVTIPDLEKNIAEAFSSMLDFRVMEYKRQNHLPVDNPRIAIIVEKQIKSDVSGIAFSLNPTNNAFDEAVINASFGLGETIVSGQVMPDTYVVDKVTRNIIEKKIMHKLVGLWLKENGGTVEKANSAPEAQALTEAQILEVAALAAGCEKHYGKPMDTEWAIEGGKLYLLQSRPITTYNPLFPEMLTLPCERKNLYLDLMVLTQGFFEPVSELGLDIWSRMLVAAKLGTMPEGKDGYFFNVGGREYMHVSNMAKGLGKQLFSMLKTYELPIREVFQSLDIEHEYIALVKSEKMKKAGRNTLGIMISFAPGWIGAARNPLKAGAGFEKAVADTYSYYKQKMLQEGTFGDTVDHGISAFRALCKRMGGVGFTQIAMNNLKKLFKDQGVDDLLVMLGTSLPNNPTAQMGRQMVALASYEELHHTATEDEFIQRLANNGYSKEFVSAYHDYMERFGARGVREIDIAVPRTSEDPRAFFHQLKAIDIHQSNVDKANERKNAAYQQLLALARKLGKEKQFTNNAQRYMALWGYRETPKYLFVVMVGELRKRALELGRLFVTQGRLESPEQVFDLTVEQVAEAEANPALDLRFIREKNLEPRKAVAHIKDWPKIVNSRGKIFRYVRPSKEGDLAGEPISPGTARGKAKVLGSPYEKPLEKGEILVTRATEPSWTPIFINAAGVVLEIGGPIQHGAIIAREYGIPCVSGIDDATKLIKDGDLLEVDGSGGVVKIIKENEA